MSKKKYQKEGVQYSVVRSGHHPQTEHHHVEVLTARAQQVFVHRDVLQGRLSFVSKTSVPGSTQALLRLEIRASQTKLARIRRTSKL